MHYSPDLLGHFPDHKIQNASVLEVSKLNICIKATLHLKWAWIIDLIKQSRHNSTNTKITSSHYTLTVSNWPGFKSCGTSTEYNSLPVRPSFSAFSPSRNCKGMIPIPTRFDLCILSKLSAITALMPCIIACVQRRELKRFSGQDSLGYAYIVLTTMCMVI